jgi:hypothetical protein
MPVYVCSAAPNKGSLRATNGLLQKVVLIPRTVGRVTFRPFSQDDILGGYFTYIVLLAAVCGSLCFAVQLPWK